MIKCDRGNVSHSARAVVRAKSAREGHIWLMLDRVCNIRLVSLKCQLKCRIRLVLLLLCTDHGLDLNQVQLQTIFILMNIHRKT